MRGRFLVRTRSRCAWACVTGRRMARVVKYRVLPFLHVQAKSKKYPKSQNIWQFLYCTRHTRVSQAHRYTGNRLEKRKRPRGKPRLPLHVSRFSLKTELGIDLLGQFCLPPDVTTPRTVITYVARRQHGRDPRVPHRPRGSATRLVWHRAGTHQDRTA
jgi:hypothetical protein